MTQEVELKLTISPSSANTLLQLDLIQNIPSDTFFLENTYFDTDSRLLTNAGSALRIRKKGHHYVQTLKNRGVNIGGLHRRQEWEMAISDQALNLSLFPESALPESIHSEALSPLFSTNFKRRSWQIDYRQSKIELVFDSGEVVTDNGSDTISELELELKSGQLADLFDLALGLSEKIAVMPSDISKAERGYRICQNNYEVDVSLPDLVPEQSMESAFCALFGYEMERLQRHWQLFWSTQQWLHLQAFLNTLGNMEAEIEWFHGMLPDDHIHFVYGQLSWIQQALHPILSWWPACFALSQDADGQPQNVALSLQQNKAKKALYALKALQDNPELGHRMLSLTAWLHGRDWRDGQSSEHRKVADKPVTECIDYCFDKALNSLQSACFAGSASNALSQSPAVRRLLTLCQYFDRLYGRQLGSIKAPLQALNDNLSRLSAIDVVMHLKDWLNELPFEQQASVHSWTRSSTVLLRDIKYLANRLIANSRQPLTGGHV
ncbi:MAG: CYTH domain-containing protein [Reinekea sp.]|jgi:triphosphatase